MSLTDESPSNSLLGHESELEPPRWKEESRKHRTRSCSLVFIATLLLIPVTILFVLYLPWTSASKAPAPDLTTTPETVSVVGPTRDLRLLLRPEDHVSRDPTIQYFSWNITKGKIAPNGVQKDVFLINGQFPGPTIEARSGDVLEIEVFNFAEEGISLHWHGLHMRGANHMDGPVGITQCAIQHGQTFTYRVPIDEQAGTFWYHAHSELQRADGLYGGLVVHNHTTPLENVSYQYDKELLFLVGDWYHWPSDKVLANFMDRTSMGTEPCPDSLLVNGLGYFECGMATHGSPVDCSEVEKPWILLDKVLRYRVRLVNVGSLTGFSFTIPDVEMKVIQVDGGGQVESSELVNSVGVLYPAERVDLVVSWPETVVDTDTKIIVELDKEYFLRPNFALTPTQSFLVSPASLTPQPPNNTTGTHRFNLREAKGPPLFTPLPDPDKLFMIYTTIEILNRLGSRPHGFINHTTWEPQAVPLLASPRETWNEHQLIPWTGPEPVWVELTINNIDNSGHPFHLHGFDFHLISSYEGKGGWDYYNPFESKPPRGGAFNTMNPVRKDTVYVPPWGYVVIRFLADHEGIWALHCHVMWHAGSGMVMGFQVLGDEGGLGGGEMGRQAAMLCGG
ncbi:uncharacterized protein LY89DRAFT_783068 [Mollisia scopiformis]|uniref:Multicopper oxidase n=1 Tax=Mollisia scopiformis TaxID=149040 RepID=A0A194X6K1_MOLSC|nr:uncharacterized protein LY89DRAFT_783068 [Mollisia scopiformis]KUJ15800.1 hypothetical protein LY89DRAFT_783068 [Mollisia scopiformis]